MPVKEKPQPKTPKSTEKQLPLFDEQKKSPYTKAEVAKAAEALTKRCYEVELKINWFQTSKQLAEELALEMADVVNAELKALSIAKRIFSSENEFVAKANEARRALEAYFKSVTFPLSEIPVVTVAKAEGLEAAGDSEEVKRKMQSVLTKAAGRRGVFAEDMDDLYDQIERHTKILQAAAAQLQANLEKVKADDKARLRDAFDERDYPANIAKKINVRFIPTEVSLNADFEECCPRSAAKLRKVWEQRLQETVELTAGDFAKNLVASLQTAARAIGNRIRLLPDRSGEWGFLRDAEVLEIRRHEDDPEVPEGCYAILVRYAVAGETEKKSKKAEEWFGPFTQAEFEQLRPQETQERRAVKDAVLENLMAQIEEFRVVGQALGDAGKPLAEVVDRVKDLFAKAGGTNEEILREMKESKYFRKQAAEELNTLTISLSELIEHAPVSKPGRRSISKIKRRMED